jgi:hypothetical protein
MRLTDNPTSRSKSESSDDSCLELRRWHRIFVPSERVPHSCFSNTVALLGALKFVFWCTKAHLPSWQFISVIYAAREPPIFIKDLKIQIVTRSRTMSTTTPFISFTMLFTQILEANITFHHFLSCEYSFSRPALSQRQARASFFESSPYENESSILAINL